MHMADPLLSPAVGGIMWAGAAGAIAYSSKKVKKEIDNKKIPLMGVMGAFIFAAQMINFSIPGTGSSGHLAGGMILAILLGPYAGLLTIASVLIIQALFFADGGILALGCNIINIGFFSCFVTYPLIYKKIKDDNPLSLRSILAVIISAIIGLQLGAFFVVLETFFSGISELTFGKFLLLMQPIHLAIGFIEGIVTIAVISFVWRARPEIINKKKIVSKTSLKVVIIGVLATSIIIGGIFSWFASSHPDGLEWAIFHITGKEKLDAKDNKIYSLTESIQEKLAFLPDYDFKKGTENVSNDEKYPAVSSGTSVSGIIGGIITLLLVIMAGFLFRIFKKKES